MLLKQAFEENVRLKDYTSYGIGGPARLFITIKTLKDMKELLADLHKKQERYMILGKGSNTLFDDRGFDGVVILNKICHLAFTEKEVRVGAGYSFPLLSSKASRKHLSGLEFASGIPGTVGGAIFMNAGAHGRETKDALKSVEYIDEKGDLHIFSKEQCDFSYRNSRFQKERGGAIVSATFALSTNTESPRIHKQCIEYRLKTQPYKERSCGCIFRNPKEIAAGALIEELGFKGYKKNGAAVSEKHANFILNKNRAKSADIQKLVAEIKQRAKKEKGIELISEVRIIPYEETNCAK